MSTGYLLLYAGAGGMILTLLLAVGLVLYFPKKKKRLLDRIREEF
ncbi:MAG: hypothetical protein PUB10_05815 [Clostridiales bacterium]|nr:hypothetical protein [Clostridiales bacterium]